MQLTKTVMLVLAATVAARADFSFTVVVKDGDSTQTKRCYVKGHRMMTETDTTISLWDLDAETLTIAQKSDRTYQVRQAAVSPSLDRFSTQSNVKETGQHKTIGGFSATQSVMTLEMSNMRGGMRTQTEGEMWYSRDVPGAQDLAAFYKRKAEVRVAQPGGRSGLGGFVAEMERRMGNLGVVPLLIITRIKATGGDPKMVQQINSAMNEVTEEWSGFSTGLIPDSVFTLPAGYRRTP